MTSIPALLRLGETTLEGNVIQLEPIGETHRNELQVAADHEEIWRYMPYQATKNGFDVWFEDTLNKMSVGEQITYVVRLKKDRNVLGATAYYDMQFEHKRLTLGYSWLTPVAWGSVVNPESKLLLLTQAFEVLNMNRVEIGTDSRNLRSYHAIKKLGATEEGLLRQHMILHGNVITDTIIFSILAAEWPTVKSHMIAKIMEAHS